MTEYVYFVSYTNSELVSLCLKWLGGRLVAYLGGAKDTATVKQWTLGNKYPDDRGRANLQIALAAISILATVDSPVTIQSWFQGMNPSLNNESPAYTIKTRQANWMITADNICRAARQYVSGGFA